MPMSDTHPVVTDISDGLATLTLNKPAKLTDDEQDALGLPSGDRDIPLMITDRSFHQDGSFSYPANHHGAGVDDAHFYRMDNIEKAAHGIPHDAFSILLSHTPEIYRQAAHADFNVLLAGHTHGGQMCLPGGIPVTLNCVLPRAMGNGSFKHHDMIGYTSAGAGVCIVPARFNCPPEITLHHLHRPS